MNRCHALLVLLVGWALIAADSTAASLVKLPMPEVADLPARPELPDVFTMLDGTKVTSREQWQQRRAELKAVLEHYELGHAPPPPGNVAGDILKSQPVLDGAAIFQLVHLKFGPEQRLGFDVAIFTPAKGGPFPTFINPSFFGTPGTTVANLAPPTNSTRPNFNAPQTPEAAARGFSNQLARGYAIVTYHYTQCGEDHAGFRTNSFYPAYPDCDWGVLRGWAWGLSRVVDYVETQPFADKTKLIALGHSRLGKLVMVATAFDERIAMGAPAGSSGAGTGAYRFCGPGRGGAEGIEDMTRKFPYYFVPRLKEFTGQMDKLPFDTHWFVALTAPRPWISLEGLGDKICRPAAVVQTVMASRPVYEFLGTETNRVTANFEPHGHGLPPEDWNAAMDFADKHLRGMKVQREFGQFPAEAMPAPMGSAPSTNFVPR